MADLLPLSRTAALADFSDCDSVAVWQQCHAIDAYQRWLGSRVSDGLVLCINWGAAHFRAPGYDPIYYSHSDPLYGRMDGINYISEQEAAENDWSQPRGNGPLSAVFALSVLDRVDMPVSFLRAYVERLLPGGLLVCTFAVWDADGDDCAVGHELRKRIYDRDSWLKLLRQAKTLGLHPFGGVDLHYRGDTFGDHTLATLVVTKGR